MRSAWNKMLHQPVLAELPAMEIRTMRKIPTRQPATKAHMMDVVTDKWVSKMFSIIDSGPSGGFVRYVIDSRNRLVVDKTGNRSNLDDLVNEVLPKDACRYIAYNYRYQKGGIATTKLVWFLWTPKAAPDKEPNRYAEGLASTLIGLNAQSSIPILKGNSPTDLVPESIIQQI